jgi:hypothetical protein
MIVVSSRAVRLFAATMVLTACTTGQQRLADPSPGPMEGTMTFSQAAQEAGAGRFAVADKILADYAVRYPATSEAADAMYWRALYRLDPANPNASAREAAQLLDGYIATNNGTHRMEAPALRRLAGVIEARAIAAANVSSAPKLELPKPDDPSKDEELKRVRDELAKANAELERIKRRLAQPKP